MFDSLDDALTRLHGTGRRNEFLAAGVSAVELQAALGARRLVRVRHGTYASPVLDGQIVRALRVGGVLAGSSAARLLGLWQPPGTTLTVSVPPHCGRLRDPDDPTRALADHRDVEIRYDGHLLDPIAERMIVGVERCLVQVLDSRPPEYALAVIDSALRLAGETAARLAARLDQQVPDRARAILSLATPRAEAGTESILRWHLIRLGIPHEIQYWVSDRIRVDFLVGSFLVVECTSYAYHASPSDYESDRARIAEVMRLGYVVLELTYNQVLFGWPAAEAALLAAWTRG